MASEKQMLADLNKTITEALVKRVKDDPDKYLDDLQGRELTELLKRKVTQAKPDDSPHQHQVIALHESLKRLPEIPECQKELRAARVIILRQETQLAMAEQETQMWREKALGNDSAWGHRLIRYVKTLRRYADEYIQGLRNHLVDDDYVNEVLERLKTKKQERLDAAKS